MRSDLPIASKEKKTTAARMRSLMSIEVTCLGGGGVVTVATEEANKLHLEAKISDPASSTLTT